MMADLTLEPRGAGASRYLMTDLEDLDSSEGNSLVPYSRLGKSGNTDANLYSTPDMTTRYPGSRGLLRDDSRGSGGLDDPMGLPMRSLSPKDLGGRGGPRLSPAELKAQVRLRNMCGKPLRPDDVLVTRILTGEKSYWEALDEMRNLCASLTVENEKLKTGNAKATTKALEVEQKSRAEIRRLQTLQRVTRDELEMKLQDLTAENVRLRQSRDVERALQEQKVHMQKQIERLKQDSEEKGRLAAQRAREIHHLKEETQRSTDEAEALKGRVESLQAKLAEAISQKNLLLIRVKKDIRDIQDSAQQAREAVLAEKARSEQQAAEVEKHAQMQLQLHERKIRDLQQTVASEESQGEYYRRKYEEASKQLAKLKTQFDSTQNKTETDIALRERKLQELSESLNAAQKARDRSAQELNAMRSKYNILRGELEKAEQRRNHAEQEAIRAGAQVETMDVGRSTLEAKVSELQLERSGLMEKLQLAEKEVSELREAKNKIKASLDLAYQKEQFRLLEENSRIGTDLKVAQQQLDTVTRQKEQLQTDAERLRGAEEELREMQVDFLKMKTTLQLVQGRPCDNAKVVADGVVNALRAYAELKKATETQEQSMASLSQQNQALSQKANEAATLTREMLTLESENRSLNEHIASLTAELRKIGDQQTALQLEKEAQDEAFRQQIERVQKEAEARRRELDHQLEQAKERHRQETTKLTAELDRVKKLHDAEKKRTSELQVQVEDVKAEATQHTEGLEKRYQEQLRERNAQIEALSSEREEFAAETRAEIQQLKKTHADALKAARADRDKVLAERESHYQQQLEEMRTRQEQHAASQHHQRQELQQRLQQLELSFQETEANLRREVDAKAADVRSLQGQKEKLERELGAVKERLEDEQRSADRNLERVKRERQQDVERLQKELDDATRLAAEAERTAAEKIQSLETDAKNTRDQLKKANAGSEEKESLLEASKTRYADLENKHNDVVQKFNDLSEENKKLKKDLSAAADDKEAKEKQIKKLTDAQARDQQEIAAIKQKEREAIAAGDRLNAEIEKLKAEHRSAELKLKNDIDAVTTDKEAVEAKLAQVQKMHKEEAEALNSRITQLTKEKADLEKAQRNLEEEKAALEQEKRKAASEAKVKQDLLEQKIAELQKQNQNLENGLRAAKAAGAAAAARPAPGAPGQAPPAAQAPQAGAPPAEEGGLFSWWGGGAAEAPPEAPASSAGAPAEAAPAPAAEAESSSWGWW
ncbi:hypothetical protein TGRUB_239300 [Toxoplasma gondii RUB]|uniref:Uncharacterized protein n=1 Tax=Toxoplasma gondii RUB TaxID=935652 RepID=A0A086LSM8_TOXGO|nr:hypothetical protein TGRUB_239300 [Toxoplasma gondii RUB]